MRAGGIFNLTWDRISLKDKVIRLQAEDTKTSETNFDSKKEKRENMPT
jgi:hypothetical protein